MSCIVGYRNCIYKKFGIYFCLVDWSFNLCYMINVVVSNEKF